MRERVGPHGARATVLIAHPGTELYGTDRMMLETIAALVERGWRVVVVLPSEGLLIAESERLGAEATVIAAPVLRKNLVQPRNLLRYLVGSIGAWRRIGLQLTRLRPDVVYVSTLTLPLWIGRARALRIPVIVHVHESEHHAPSVVRAALALPLRLADRVLVNSDFSRTCLTEAIPSLTDRSVVVYNGVTGPSQIRAARLELRGGLRVVYVGRLSPRKGVDVAVASVARLIERGIDARLDLVGSAFAGYEWYEEQLREQVAALGLKDRVTFRGFQPSVWGAFEDADVAVVPSRLAEPFGNTAIEAVLAARPAVVSMTGGLREAIDGIICAIPVPPDDVDAMTDALQRIAANWSTFRRTAATFAPIAAHRYSTAAYRTAVAREVTRVAQLGPEHALAS